MISSSSHVETAIKETLGDYLSLGQDKTIVKNGKEITLFPKNQKSLLETKNIELTGTENFTGFLDALMPNANDVS